MQPAGEFLQVGIQPADALHGAVQLFADVLQVGGQRRFHRAELEPQRNDPLLRTVMQVAFEPAPGLVGGRHDARS